ncbi:armadillo-type protein [Lineolata rhizophorae]|uniref:Exportin-T n=1 Tax=Lineolata rhizophorae TaxID=578093 RepID=A0A6A6PBJ0_9PEZI|nr:armadillo-type protein [Lineolata rhizophorae]
MDVEAQIESAVQIAWNPSADQSLKQQAFTFLNGLRQDPTCWQACLALFTRFPRSLDVVRHVSLEVVNNAIVGNHLEPAGLAYVRDALMNYIRTVYAAGGQAGPPDDAHIQNKLAQTMTYLFDALYASGWESFFDDFRALAGESAESIGVGNPAATVLYLRLLSSVHDEIADVLVPRDAANQRRANELKDLVRARDAPKIAASWREILAKWRQEEPAVVESCLKTLSRWVSWIDISLVVGDEMLGYLLDIAGQQGVGPSSSDSPQTRVRDAAIDTFTEIVSKKMKPADKISLIVFLRLPTVVHTLLQMPALEAQRFTSDYDTDLAEKVARLVNATVTDVVRALEAADTPDDTRRVADDLMQAFVPNLLRLLSDEYDEICSTVIHAVTDLLNALRRIVSRSGGALSPQYAALLPSILEAIISKMKYDETSSWGEEDDETDEAEFQDLRRRLDVLQQIIASIDPSLYIDTMSRIVGTTLAQLNQGGFDRVDWRELELALHETFIFGDFAAKREGMYAKQEPTSAASARLIEMMRQIVESDVGNYPHPAIHLLYMDTCVRYIAFFENNASAIPKALENFVRLIHVTHIKVRCRSWYLFQRFVKPLRNQLGDVAKTVIQAIADLLVIKAELPSDRDGDGDDDSEDKSQPTDPGYNPNDETFMSQLYLFEAVGNIAAPAAVSAPDKVLIASSVIGPIFEDMSRNLDPAKAGDERALNQIHHDIMALGTLAKGFADALQTTSLSSSSTTSAANAGGSAPPPQPQLPDELAAQFDRCSEAILVALQDLARFPFIRGAARFAFSRLQTVMGPRVLAQLPRWIDGLIMGPSAIAASSAGEDGAGRSAGPDSTELAALLRTLVQLVYAFRESMRSVLEELLTGLLERVFEALAAVPQGTDDALAGQELRREYVGFLGALLAPGSGVEFVLVSERNQASFDRVVASLVHFAKSAPGDAAAAKGAVGVMKGMVGAWGGPVILLPGGASAAKAKEEPTSPTTAATNGTNGVGAAGDVPRTPDPQPWLPGFDAFAVARFAPLPFEVPASAGFKASDAQSRAVLAELAALQVEMARRFGAAYLVRVRELLGELGVGEEGVGVYVGRWAKVVERRNGYGKEAA